jgi:hypothetical protein
VNGLTCMVSAGFHCPMGAGSGQNDLSVRVPIVTNVRTVGLGASTHQKSEKTSSSHQ